MNPSKPSEWIAERTGFYLRTTDDPIESCAVHAVCDFLDLLHSQGKIEMPDNVQPPKSSEAIEGMKLIKAVFNPEKQ